MLKTAGGYLIVLQTFDEESNGLEQCVRLMQMAKEEGDWELCTELARFLMALDETGNELRKAVEKMGISLQQPSSSLTPVSKQLDSENEEYVEEENPQSKTVRSNSNGAPKEYAVERLDTDNEVSPKSSVKEEIGMENRDRYEDRQEDYFSHKGRA